MLKNIFFHLGINFLKVSLLLSSSVNQFRHFGQRLYTGRSKRRAADSPDFEKIISWLLEVQSWPSLDPWTQEIMSHNSGNARIFKQFKKRSWKFTLQAILGTSFHSRSTFGIIYSNLLKLYVLTFFRDNFESFFIKHPKAHLGQLEPSKLYGRNSHWLMKIDCVWFWPQQISRWNHF